MCGTDRLDAVEAPDLPRDQPKPRHPGGLLAALEQGLEPDADPEEGPPLGQVRLQRLHITQGMQPLHGRPEGPDPGEDQPLGLEDVLRAFDLGEGKAQGLDGVAQAAHIAGAIVQERDHGRLPRG